MDGAVAATRGKTVARSRATRSGDMAALVEALLDQDGSVTSSSLAKLAGVSVRTAQRRIKKLVESGVLAADEVDGRSYRRR